MNYPIIKYSPSGEEVYYELNGFVKETTPNDEGVLITRYHDTHKSYYQYDHDNRLIHFKNDFKFESWREYEDNGNIVKYRDSDGLHTITHWYNGSYELKYIGYNKFPLHD